MIPRELFRKVRQIQIRTSKTVNDLLAGQYHSAFRGRGMEFEEVCPYQIGDDVRLIDWNVSARFGEPFVKRFREERELTVMLVVDVSPSGLFGSVDRFKLEVASELCAVLALAAVRSNDKVGLILFTDRVEKFVPAKKGVRHVLRIIRELLYHQARGRGTDLAAALNFLNRVTIRKTVCFLVSDFLESAAAPPDTDVSLSDGARRGPDRQTGRDRKAAARDRNGSGNDRGGASQGPSNREAWLRIARRRHDLIPVVVTDPREEEFPDIGLVQWEDPESGRLLLVDTRRRGVRRVFTEAARHRRAERESMFARMDLPVLNVRTDRSYVEPLVRYLHGRERRR